MTTRGFKEIDFGQVAEFMVRVIEIIGNSAFNKRKIAGFKAAIKKSDDLEKIKQDVIHFVSSFPLTSGVEI